MKWTEIQEPTPQIPYDHIVLNSPLGTFTVESKREKELSYCDVYLNEELLYAAGSLESAKEFVRSYLTEKRDQLIQCLEQE